MKRIRSIKTIEKINQTVLLQGWLHFVRDKGKIIFLELRDSSGIVQSLVLPEQKEAFAIAKKLNVEDVIEIIGRVNSRPEKQVKKELSTGQVEIEIEKIKIINKAVVLPFEINRDEFKEEVKEELRLKYRYLDLRRREYYLQHLK